jgi:hypothetical protein
MVCPAAGLLRDTDEHHRCALPVVRPGPTDNTDAHIVLLLPASGAWAAGGGVLAAVDFSDLVDNGRD